MRLQLAAVMLVLAALSGCGPTNLREACEDATNALCRQLYRCRPDEARAVWPNIQDCANALFDAVPDCSADASRACRVDPYLSSACIDDVDNLRCDGALELPASCDLPCQ